MSKPAKRDTPANKIAETLTEIGRQDAAKAVVKFGAEWAASAICAAAMPPKPPNRPQQYPDWFRYLVWAHIHAQKLSRPNAAFSAKRTAEIMADKGGISWEGWQIANPETIRTIYSRANAKIEANPSSQMAMTAQIWATEIMNGEDTLSPLPDNTEI